jgi:hypothetical protein
VILHEVKAGVRRVYENTEKATVQTEEELSIGMAAMKSQTVGHRNEKYLVNCRYHM